MYRSVQPYLRHLHQQKLAVLLRSCQKIHAFLLPAPDLSAVPAGNQKVKPGNYPINVIEK